MYWRTEQEWGAIEVLAWILSSRRCATPWMTEVGTTRPSGRERQGRWRYSRLSARDSVQLSMVKYRIIVSHEKFVRRHYYIHNLV